MIEATHHIRTITSQGQVTIPIEIRRLLAIGPGEQVAFQVLGDRVTIEPALSLEATHGAVVARSQPEDFQTARDVAIEEHVQDVIREMNDRGW